MYRSTLKIFLFVFLWVVASAAHAAGKPVILVLGDSLSAAYGMEHNTGWVSLLQKRLTSQDYPHRIVNASISGDTTSGALARVDRALDEHRPAIVIVELGGNDGLRGLPVDAMRANLAAIIERSLARGARVLLVGMQLPPNYGPAYTKRFRQVYVDLARHYSVTLLPFLLEGIADKPELMQTDGVHPRAPAQARIMENVWEVLQPML
ncbi:MAG: arylesterase [Pseudomonadota bacterium]